MVVNASGIGNTRALRRASGDGGSCADNSNGALDNTALAQVRTLKAPAAHSTQNGEYEDSDFWQNNEAIIQEALLELGPLRSYVYAPQKLADVFQPAVVAALEEPSPTDQVQALLVLVQPTAVEGVWALPLFSSTFCAHLLEEIAHLRTSGVPLRRPNGMNRYGAILTDLGFQMGLLELVASKIVRPLAKALYPQWIQGEEVEEIFGFLVRYDMSGDVALAEHADAACVTLNVCLGPEKDGNEAFEGGELGFRGVRFQDADASTRPQTVIKHQVGVAMLHLGQHLHQATPITSGERENMIMWMTGKCGWVRVRPYVLQDGSW
eukprot:CAMPEP_0179450516 /NCGR_PEP_ID=MMETSP0799-20121207/34483_1 /TAXON_ID=46947 /ORGANISM="Geminigera cryophila, Strain CCMP2564" /LENGTH=321 /DNA_ID=CAMNT_0021244679 /DNA_START=162 /DNA_END=1124 /DNA_ORIENTATION=+